MPHRHRRNPGESDPEARPLIKRKRVGSDRPSPESEVPFYSRRTPRDGRDPMKNDWNDDETIEFEDDDLEEDDDLDEDDDFDDDEDFEEDDIEEEDDDN